MLQTFRSSANQLNSFSWLKEYMFLFATCFSNHVINECLFYSSNVCSSFSMFIIFLRNAVLINASALNFQCARFFLAWLAYHISYHVPSRLQEFLPHPIKQLLICKLWTQPIWVSWSKSPYCSTFCTFKNAWLFLSFCYFDSRLFMPTTPFPLHTWLSS